MVRYEAAAFSELKDETIIRVSRSSNDAMPKLNPYNGVTLYTESGRELIIWNSMGESNLNEIFRDEK